MQMFLRWLGDVVGGFAAAFLVYVVVGGFLGLVIASSMDDMRPCWPTRFWTQVVTHCSNDDPRGAFWYATIDLPAQVLAGPALAVRSLSEPRYERASEQWHITVTLDDGIYYVAETETLFLSIITTTLLALLGFLAWCNRSVTAGCALIVALAGEITFVLATWP